MNRRERLERIQAWAFGVVGRDPAELEADIDALRNRKRQDYWHNRPEWESAADHQRLEIETDPIVQAQVDELYRRFRTTRFQDPVRLGGIAAQFDTLIESADEHVDGRKVRVRPPLLSTVPLMILNGFVIRDTAGDYGIILEEGLRFTPMRLAYDIGRFLFTPHADTFAINFDFTFLTENLERQHDIAHDLPMSFVVDAVHYGSAAPSQSEYQRVTSHADLKFLHDVIELGFKNFVLAHEYAHCIRDHFGQLERRSTHGYVLRQPAEIKEAWRRFREKYAHVAEPDNTQYLAFCELHAIEFDADATAATIVLAPALQGDPTLSGPARLLLVGICLFFWYAEMMERVARTFVLGSAWFDDPLYREDTLVEELLHRRTYPAPLSRLQRLTATLRARDPTNQALHQAIDAVERWLFLLFEITWKDHRQNVAQGIRDLGCGMHPKFVQSIPIPGLMLGMANQQERHANAPVRN